MPIVRRAFAFLIRNLDEAGWRWHASWILGGIRRAILDVEVARTSIAAHNRLT
jgi:hypothetical protein